MRSYYKVTTPFEDETNKKQNEGRRWLQNELKKNGGRKKERKKE